MKSWSCVPLLLLMLLSASHAATIHVPGEQPTIASAIGVAATGDTVLIACGTYAEHSLFIDTEICIRSETGDPDCVTVSAQGLGRVFACEGVGEAARIEGLTITDGLAQGVPNYDRGGGLHCLDASPTISDCVFINNEGPNGGGAVACRNADPVVERCHFAGNEAIDGGAIHCTESSPTITECSFFENDAQFWGGAIFCTSYSSPVISRSTVVANGAHWGGGFWCVHYCYPVIEDCVFAFSEEGEGIYVYDNPSHPSEVTVVCCDVFGNAGGNYGGVIGDQTGINGNISEHPLFCDLEAGDLHLATPSPCLPDNNSCGVQMGAFGEGCAWPTAVAGSPPLAGLGSRGVPNPFTPATEILFALPQASRVELRIFDASGRLVRRLVAGEVLAGGQQRVGWDGLDERGTPLRAGVYFYRLTAGSVRESGKLTLLD